MNKIYAMNRLIILIVFLLLGKMAFSQTKKPFDSLTANEYQQLKTENKLQVIYPELFPASVSTTATVFPKQLAQNPKSATKSKSKTLTNAQKSKAPTVQSMQLVDCGTLYYEPPITNPIPDLNGDMVTDTIVEFTNGTAPMFRNDDGHSPALTLPFQFCFYGNVINAPGSANQNMYVNNNGNISFGNFYTTYLPPNFPVAGFTMIGAFFADIDTRGANSGVVYMRRMPHYAIFKWDRVGYYSNQDDKLNSFMIVISDGTSPIIPNGLNAAIYYGDMQWALGSTQTSDPIANASTVGANAGDGTQFFKIGRFDAIGTNYDGPNGANDGVDWLDNKNFYFSACGSSNNLAPVALGLNICDTLSVCSGDTFNFDFTYIGPEFNQNVTITIVPPVNTPGFSSWIDYTAPTAPIGHVSYFSPTSGIVQFQVFATDNASPPLSSNLFNVTLQTTLLDGSATHTNAGCLIDNGTIAFNLNSGSPPYALSIDNGATFSSTTMATNLAGGTYNVQLKDVGGCTLDTVITITQPSPPVFDTNSTGLGFTQVSCNGGSNGSAAIQVTGEPNSSFIYSWLVPNPPSISTSSISGLPANASSIPSMPDYWFIAIDTVNLCRDSIMFHITEPAVLVATVPTRYILCQNDTNLIAVVVGGTLPYNFQWSAPTSVNNDTITNLPPGTYTVEIVDAHFCQTLATGDLLDVSHMSYSLSTTNATCHGLNDGAAEIILSNGLPSYNVTWHLGTDTLFESTDDTSNFDQLKKGNGFVVISCSNNCPAETIPFSILEPDTLMSVFTTINATCDVAKNGGVKVDVIGGVQPYTYLWDTDHNQTLQGVNGLGTNLYTVQITDANNCSITSSTFLSYDSNFVITKKPDFVYDEQADNSMWVTVNKPGTYLYSWNNGQYLNDSLIANPALEQIFFPQTFKVEIVDEFGCYATDSINVDVVPFLYFPTAFSPNGDLINDTLVISLSNQKIKDFNLDIYDRWGGKIFNSKKANFKWDGKVNGQELTVGIYNYYISYIDNRKKTQKLAGTISLVR
jgi:gliding motility-associated-like protein